MTNKNFKYSLPIILGALVLLGFILWKFGNQDLQDFGLNFFTEILGVVITVLIIDKLVKDREQKKMAPLKLAEYEDAVSFFTEFTSFWRDAYSISVNEEFPNSFDDFLSNKGIGKVFENLDLNTEPNVTPKRTWWNWITQNHKIWKDKSDKYLERHATYSDPELYKLIHGFSEGTFMKLLPLINSIKQSDIHKNFPRLSLLSHYAMQPTPKDYEILRDLKKLLENLNKQLSKDFPDLKLFKYNPVELSKRNIRCSLSQETLEKYLKEKKKFEENNRR